MIDEETYKAYASALEANADLVNNAIIALERELGGLTGSALEQALAARYSAIVKEYGQIAAQAAIEFYISVREAANVEQAYEPVASQSKSVKTLSKDVSEVMGSQSVLADKLKNLGGYGIRRTMEQASDTIIDNVYLDYARPCWAIVPRVGACGWCIMLGSQGFVYRSNTTADSARHRWCKCVTVVDFDTKNPHLKGYDQDGLYERYRTCRDAIEKDAHYQWYNVMSDEEKAQYGNNRRSDYDHYLRNRIVSEINKRDKDWTLTGKVTQTDYSLNAKTKYGILKKANDFSSVKIANKGNEWRDLRAHYVLEQNGIVAQAQGRESIDLIISGQYWEVKSPEQPKTPPKAGRELSFIESNIRSAVKQFEKRKLAAQTRVVLNPYYRKCDEEKAITETKRQMEMHGVKEILYLKSDGSVVRLIKD